jgi:hypothetical protein
MRDARHFLSFFPACSILPWDHLRRFGFVRFRGIADPRS